MRNGQTILAGDCTYGELPPLFTFIGNAPPATDTRLLGADEPMPAPPPEPKTFEISKEMAVEFKGRLKRSNTQIFRTHMARFMALLRFFYNVRLNLVGNKPPTSLCSPRLPSM